MYLTAHKVVAPDGIVGINAFLYHHRDFNNEYINWERPDVRAIAEKYPGILVAESIEIAQGGNRVLSYIDIAAHDDTRGDLIVAALKESADELVRSEKTTLLRPIKNICILFSCNLDLEKRRGMEFEELKRSALDLLGNKNRAPLVQEQPLVVLVEHSEDEVTYRLNEESAGRLSSFKGPDWKAPVMKVEYAVAHSFILLHGDIIPHLALLLTSLASNEILKFGGVLFREARTGKIVAEWLPRPK